MTDNNRFTDLIEQLRNSQSHIEAEAAEAIELLQRQLRCSEEFELATWVNYWRDKDAKALQSRIAELEAALKPFADDADEYEGLGVQNKDKIFVKINACRRAKAVLEKNDG